MKHDSLRGVSFDCWGTLLFEPDPAATWARRVRAVARAGRELGVGGEPAAARTALDAAWHRHVEVWMAGGSSGAPEIAEATLAGLGAERGAAAPPVEAVSALALELAAAPLEGGVEPLGGAREALERLAGRGLRRALVCDTGLSPGSVVRELLAGAGLLELLECTVFSDEVGAPKPDRRPFAAALRALGLTGEPASVVHVGDLRRTDVAGARAAGLRTVRIRDHHDDRGEGPEADAVADSHPHLLELLGVA